MWKLALKISAAIVLLTIVACAFFHITKIETPKLFCLIPLYFVLTSIFLSIFAEKNIESKKILPKMLFFRFATVFCGIIVLLVGFVFDKENILMLTILFVIYYVLFSVFETQTMIKIVKK